MHRLNAKSHQPGCLCAVTSSPSQLLFCVSKTKKVHLVDCSTRPPQGKIPIVYDRQKIVVDMCTSGDLLVLTRRDEGVFAYTLDGGELKWRASRKLPGMQHDIDASGVAAHDQGHLLVCDESNRCVHMLSERNGMHLGVVLREEEEGVGRLWNVAWHRESASLIVAHMKDGVNYLRVFCR